MDKLGNVIQYRQTLKNNQEEKEKIQRHAQVWVPHVVTPKWQPAPPSFVPVLCSFHQHLDQWI